MKKILLLNCTEYKLIEQFLFESAKGKFEHLTRMEELLRQ